MADPVAAVEKLCRAPLSEDAHDLHLQAAIHRVAVPHAPMEAFEVVRDDLGNPVLVSGEAGGFGTHA